MGVGISLSRLAGSMGSGGVGVISTAQIGFDQEGWDRVAGRNKFKGSTGILSAPGRLWSKTEQAGI